MSSGKTCPEIIEEISDMLADEKHFPNQLGNGFFSQKVVNVFKLEWILFEYRQANDAPRVFLAGKNALISYLVNVHGVPLTQAKSMSLDDVMLLLYPVVNQMTLPDDAVAFLCNRQLRFGTEENCAYSHYPDDARSYNAYDINSTKIDRWFLGALL